MPESGAASPLEGVRILEFPQAVAAPSAGRLLVQLGAEVIRVEDPGHLDSIRRFGTGWLPSSVPTEVARDTRPSLSSLNAGKRSIGLDLGRPEGRRIALRLVAAADVVIANLGANVLGRLGLGYEQARAVRPDIVYCNLPAFGGAPGPYREFKSWGPTLSALAGLDHLTGWPDRVPCGMGSIAYVDFLVGTTAAAAVVAAVLERDLSGEGRLLDFSQHEIAAAAIGPALLAEASGSSAPARNGNRSDQAAPHGIYPTRGPDRWIAIAVTADDQWSALCRLAAGEPFAAQRRYSKVAGRLRDAGRLDAALAAWTRRHTADELAYRLQRVGVPAGMVQDLADLASDVQLESRGFHRLLPHARFGRDLVEGSPLRVSGSAPALDRAGPALGEDTTYVLESVAGLTPDECRRLLAERVAFAMPPWPKLERPYTSWARFVVATGGSGEEP